MVGEKPRLKIYPRQLEKEKVLTAMAEATSPSRFESWLKELEEGLGIFVPFPTDPEQRIATVAGLLPRSMLQLAGTNTLPSWREMALIGDGLWRTYLRFALVKKGYQNGQIAKKTSGMESRKFLMKKGRKLNLQSYLPFVLDDRLHAGELAEAFLGWTFAYIGVEASFALAEKYLSIK